ncbi:ABC transporter substrate-binding protein [Tistrella bauzanensis]
MSRIMSTVQGAASRRDVLKYGGAAAALGLALKTGFGPRIALAADEIVIGGSLPMTGVFAFAGIAGHQGLNDYVEWLNENGGIDGRKVRYVMEDTGYKVDVSVAAFKKITAAHKPQFYFGDSTGFEKAIASELNQLGSTVMSGASFASELADPQRYPFHFIAGPSYAEQVGILLEYIKAEASGGAAPKVALVYSDTEFGRDPIASAKARIKTLGLELVDEIVTKPGSVDVSAEVLKLRRSRPDYVIFHGYVLSPINEFIVQMKQMGLKTKFMGTYYTMDKLLIDQVGEPSDGFMGVMPYNYFDSDASGPNLDAMRAYTKKVAPDVTYRPVPYVASWFTGMIFAEIARRTLAAGGDMSAKAMKAALEGIDGWDTGGIMGLPVSLKGHSVPVGRIYQVKFSEKRYVPASDWIALT